MKVKIIGNWETGKKLTKVNIIGNYKNKTKQKVRWLYNEKKETREPHGDWK